MIRSLVAVFILLVAALSTTKASVKDSTGIEKKDGKTFIVHKVDPKETLYSIARRYKVSVNDIKSNNEGTDNLSIGQMLYIPYTEPAKASTATPTTTTAGKTHTVEPKETLYSISKKYGVPVDELKKANPDAAAGLKVGQTINIPGAGGAIVKTETKKEEKKEEKEEKKELKAAEKAKEHKEEVVVAKEKSEVKPVTPPASTATRTAVAFDDGKENTFVSTNENGYVKITESGVAQEMQDNQDTPRYLAYHKTAPVGTIIQVTNTTNGQRIFVRVIGKLSSTDPKNKVILQITKRAFQRLSADGKNIRVDVSYIP